MSNYVYHKVLCDSDTLERYFLDYHPLGDAAALEEPYISFNHLFGVKSLNEYEEKIGEYIYYGFGTSCTEQKNGRYELLFCTKWVYPIEAIKRAIELSHSTEWYAVEENLTYVSKFFWDNGVKENVMIIEDGYLEWLDENEDSDNELKDCDDYIWYYLKTVPEKWIPWESDDGFARYAEPVCSIKFPF